MNSGSGDCRGWGWILGSKIREMEFVVLDLGKRAGVQTPRCEVRELGHGPLGIREEGRG